jgi:hypothetical protein
MLRALTASTAIALVCALIAAAGSSAAAAAPPRGTLTSTEYTQLTAAYAALQKALDSKTKAPSWKAAEAGCRDAGNSTALLSTQRKSCLGVVTTLHQLAGFITDESKCAKAKAIAATATTPATTTTPSTATVTVTVTVTTPAPTTTTPTTTTTPAPTTTTTPTLSPTVER